MEKNDSYKKLRENSRIKILFLFMFIIIIIALLYVFRYYIWPFLFALILYMGLRPFHEKLVSYLKGRAFTTNIVIIFLFMLVIIPFFYLIVALADQVYQLYNILQTRMESGFIDSIQDIDFVKDIMAYFKIQGEEVARKLTDVMEKTAITVFQRLTRIISFPINLVVNFLFMVIMLFFLLKDGHKLDRAFYETLPFPDELEKRVVDRLKEVIKVLLAGNLMIMAMQGAALGLGFFIAGVGMPLLWGSIAAILSLIPVVGTFLIWLPAVSYLIMTGSIISSVFLGIWCLFWYLFLENFLKPKLFGEKLKFHPVVFFFLLLGSVQTFGLPGAIIGPLILTLFYSFWNIYKLLAEYDIWDK